MATKLYPFSINKHGHDIEFYENRLYNTMCAMQTGEQPMDYERYDKISAMYYGDLQELLDAINGSHTPTAYLTGKQIGLAKKIVFWAITQREQTCIAKGRYDLLKYC